MYIKRDIEQEILEGAKSFPVLTLTGPRQSGKTTLLKHLFPEKEYVSLENPDNYELALADPKEFLNKYSNGVILDEVQRVPQLLSYIQGIVDEYKKPAQFILSGSQQFDLMSSITQSLAGRTALYKLLPFSFKELADRNFQELDEILYTGFYPRVWDSNSIPTKVYQDYFETYIQRDLRQLINISNLSLFRNFVRLCAGRVGQIFVASQLANEVGVSVNTINSWLSILETSYVVFQLSPYHTNINKRLIKSSKIYFYDVGLAANLIGIRQPAHLTEHPLKGSLFENLVVADILKNNYNSGQSDFFYFYRDSNQNEVDMIIDYLTHFDAIEIKSSRTFNKNLLNGLNYIRKILPEKTRNTYLCYSGKLEQDYQGHKLVNYKNLAENLEL